VAINPDGRGADRAYLDRQYATAEHLRVRYETHAQYSEGVIVFREWALERLAVRPGDAVCDVGCGPGGYHPGIAAAGGRVIGVDASAGMLREAHARAASASLDVACIRGSAELLPVASAACDRVLAAHMLYHVPDQQAALREMRRILRPGGRVVITANGGAPTRLEQVEADAAAELGAEPLTANPSRRFSLDSGELVRSVFTGARSEALEDALVFPSADPVMRYWSSFADDEAHGDPAREALLYPLAAATRTRINAIIAAEGVFRVAKTAGCFIADV
jgi:SAM-dependent methyltransferase